MLREYLQNRIFIGTFFGFIGFIAGCLFTLNTVENDAQQAVERTAEPHSPQVPGTRARNDETLKPDSGITHVTTAQKLRAQNRLARYKRLGIEPPPPGYDYLVIDDREVVLDTRGQPVLQKDDGTPCKIITHIGFAPTPEQHQRHKALAKELYIAEATGDTTKATQIKADMKRLEKEAKGRVPAYTYSAVVPRHLNTKEYQAELSKEAQELLNAALIHMGYEYLIPPEKPEPIFINPARRDAGR